MIPPLHNTEEYQWKSKANLDMTLDKSIVHIPGFYLLGGGGGGGGGGKIPPQTLQLPPKISEN